MFSLSDVGNVFTEFPDRALAVTATLAARGREIPEYLLEMYWATIPCPRDLLEAAAAMAVQLGYMQVNCTCSSDAQEVFCINHRIAKYPDIGADSTLADQFRCDVAEYNKLMYT